MKIELDGPEVRDAVKEAATKMVLPGRIGTVDTVVLHTAGGGGATVTFNDRPHTEPEVPGAPGNTGPAETPTVKEAETKAKAAAAKGKAK